MDRAASTYALLLTSCLGLWLAGCSSQGETAADSGTDEPVLVEGSCLVASDAPDFLVNLPCKADFLALSSVPLDSTLPGARSVKVVLDREGGDALYFQNSQKYQMHYEFVSANLSGGAHPLVPSLSLFNQSEYYLPDRRFVLGAVTYYEAPDVWALELSPYDTASPDFISKLFQAIKAQAYFGTALKFHPTSESLSSAAGKLGDAIALVSTDELYAGTNYQPLTLGESIGRLRFLKASQLDAEYLSPRDIVVLDEAPNDIAVVSGLITEQFQTPLSHVNVLSQNRGTPNMGLRDATRNELLRALEGKWIQLTVTASDWSAVEVTREEADQDWQARRPEPLVLPALDLAVTGLVDIEQVIEEDGTPLRDLLKKAAPAFGGKAAHYSILAQTPELPVRKAFAIPVYYYDQFMRDNGFYARIDTLLADPSFLDSAALRDSALALLRNDMEQAPVDAGLQAAAAREDAERLPGREAALPHQHQQRGPRGLPVRRLLRVAHRRPK